VYTPHAGYVGSDSFSFSPTDGLLAGSPVTVGLTVVNPPPIAQDAVFLFAPDATLTVGSAGGLLNYGFDPVGVIPSAALVSGPSHGTLVLASNGTFTYTPDTGYSGNDSFAYTLGDGYSVSNPATVVLKALAASANPLTVAPPSALDRTYTLGHDTLFSTLAQGIGVLTGATDPQGFPLVATLVGNVQHGKLVLLADGEFLYRPDAGYFGSDHFTYRATGGLADTIVNATEENLAAGTATGFSFNAYTPSALYETVKWALKLRRDRPAAFAQLVRTAMSQDWSWDRSAAAYESLYRKVIA